MYFSLKPTRNAERDELFVMNSITFISPKFRTKLLAANGPGVDSASNRNEYQEYFLGVKAAGA